MKEQKWNKFIKIDISIFLALCFILPATTATPYTDQHQPLSTIEQQTLTDQQTKGMAMMGDFDDPIELVYTYDFSEPTITEYYVDEELYHVVTCDELPLIGKQGKPILPVQPVNILLPQRGVIQSIHVDYENKISLGTGFHVPFGQEPSFYDFIEEIYEVTPADFDDTSTSSSREFPSIEDHLEHYYEDVWPWAPVIYPKYLYTTLDSYFCRGFEIYTLHLNPVHYVYHTKQLYYYDSITVTLTVTETGEISPRFRGLACDQSYVSMDVDIDDSFDMMESYDEYYTEGGKTGSLTDPTGHYPYVIITTTDLMYAQGDYAFQDLVNYKQDQGTPATIVTIEDIISTYDGVDTEEKIRKFIIDAYDEWETNYVLLGADHDDLPARILYLDIDGMYESEKYVPSDLYYACLDGSYNSDGDSKWGETTDGDDGGDVDLRAEVFVGRAPVETDQELSNFVEKTLTYAETSHAYLEKVLLVGEYLFGPATHFPLYWKNVFGGDYMDQLINWCVVSGYFTIGIPSSTYNIDTLYDRDWPTFDPDDPENTGWPKEELITRINDNVHIINHLGHANYESTMRIETSDLSEFTNSQPCFIYSQSCMAGGFDQEDCIAEHLLVKTNTVAFAGIWNTRYGVGDRFLLFPKGFSQHFNRQFWDAIYGESIFDPLFSQLGPAHYDAKHDNIFRTKHGDEINRYVYYELTLFGDPQLAFKTPVENNPPYQPSNPFPAHGATDVNLDITLSWTGGDPDSGDTVTYDVYLEKNDASPDALIADDITTTSFQPSTLDFESTYYWKVVATDSYDESTTSIVWSFTTIDEPNNPPYEPSDPSPSDGATGVSIDAWLSWTGGDPDGDMVRYDVYLEIGDPSPDVLRSYNQLSTTFDPGTLQYGTTYYWMIVARDSHGATTPGDVWYFTTEEATPGTIQGYVYDYTTGDPIGGVTVSTNAGDYDQTDDSGFYSMSVDPGTYTVTAQKLYYDPVYEYGVSVSSDEVVNLDFDLPVTPRWISPVAHYDFDEMWINEELAYDGDEDTAAGCPIHDSGWSEWVWTPWLFLRLEDTTRISKVRFKAWEDGIHCDGVEMKVCDKQYHSKYSYTGFFDSMEWEVHDFTDQNIYCVYIKFKVRRLLWDVVTPDLYEFEFFQVP